MQVSLKYTSPDFFENQLNNEFSAIAYHFIQKFYSGPPPATDNYQQKYDFPLLLKTPLSDEQLKEKFENLSKRFKVLNNNRIGIDDTDGAKVEYSDEISTNINILITQVRILLPNDPSKEGKIHSIAKKIFFVLGALGTVALHFIGRWELSIPATFILIQIWRLSLYPKESANPKEKETPAAVAFLALTKLYPQDWLWKAPEQPRFFGYV